MEEEGDLKGRQFGGCWYHYNYFQLVFVEL